jgi:hypothetical protein
MVVNQEIHCPIHSVRRDGRMVRVNDDLVMTRDEGEQDAGKVVMVVNDADPQSVRCIEERRHQGRRREKGRAVADRLAGVVHFVFPS